MKQKINAKIAAPKPAVFFGVTAGAGAGRGAGACVYGETGLG